MLTIVSPLIKTISSDRFNIFDVLRLFSRANEYYFLSIVIINKIIRTIIINIKLKYIIDSYFLCV